MQHFPELLPGDHLIYSGFGLADWFVMIKTGSWACHVERYDGSDMVMASRPWVGIGRYAFSRKGLSAVLRPNQPLDLEAGRHWFYCIPQQQKPYSWPELFNFFLPFSVIKTRGMTCATFIAALDRYSGLDVFNPMWPENKISPADFLKSGMFDWVWSKKW